MPHERCRFLVASRGAALATVCLAVFAINLDVTIVNVALPDLARQLHASTKDLQWVVDGYNLAFAALVLTAGSAVRHPSALQPVRGLPRP